MFTPGPYSPWLPAFLPVFPAPINVCKIPTVPSDGQVLAQAEAKVKAEEKRVLRL